MNERRVDPKVYTKSYYLNDCSGYEVFRASDGKDLEPRLNRIKDEIKIQKGFRFLDIGCGRGEMVYWAAKVGASESVGVDYSKEAVLLANSARKNWNKEIKNKTRFIHMDAKRLNFPKKYFDVVVMAEIVEHLYDEELVAILKKVRLTLKDSGVLFVHTAPNKIFNDITYRIWCYPVSSIITKVYNVIFGKKYNNIESPANIRTKYHHLMHVNEPTYFSLSNLFRNTGFTGKIYSSNITVNKPVISWKDSLFNLLVYLHPISKYFPFSVFWGNDFYVNLKKYAS